MQKHYLLFYEAAADYISRRTPFRQAHLEKAWKASDRGELVLAGALAHPVDGAVLLFRGDSPEVAERFAKADPYVIGGAVKRWYVREWTTVVGEDASTPVKSETVSRSGETPDESADLPVGDPSLPAKGVILRLWRGHASAEKAGEYVRHATGTVFPKLRTIGGHRGAYLLRRTTEGGVEFVVLTLWDSMEAVRRFATEESDKAVVEPEAQSILSRFDEFVTHFQVVYGIEGTK
jgi:heme-degrading monooxygenase HmoA/uncharacterized protein YciI